MSRKRILTISWLIGIVFSASCSPRQISPIPTPTADIPDPASVHSETSLPPTTTAAAEPARDGWITYRNEALGYSFQYPGDATIVNNDEPLKSISIIGPLMDNYNWPEFTISHPTDRVEYRPPENVDLLKWLTDHYLLGDERQPDVQIAGTIAIHIRHARSPQSYAFDRYYFARSGQLYMVLIGHAGDKEDWTLYNRFLESFQFAQ